VLFCPDREKFVFFCPDWGKICVFGRDRPFYPMHFISRFFTQKERERENRKKVGKRETATPLLGTWD
jgi:hypothetical protein